jgi:exopolyphosphatase/guanosine-5'-triphosphate,3'-diphosphate pyrophosphatase
VSEDALGHQGVAQLDAFVAQKLAPVLDPYRKQDIRRIVVTSGTLLNLVAIAASQRGEPPNGHLHNYIVTAEEITQVKRLVTRADRGERLRIKGLDTKRVDFIVVGACLADYVVRRLDAKEIVACTWALREGLLLDFIARHRRGIEETERFADVRRRSVARFVRHLGGPEQHGQQVARIALRLFDQLNGAVGLDARTREWLEFAALLHDVGHHISHENHQRHSYYLITHGDLLGFQRDELEIIAQVARYHRKGTPKGSDDGFATLSSDERRTVRALSAILRVADSLDRSHYGVVHDVTVSRRSDRLQLQLRTDGEDAELEIWEARRRVEPLEKLLDTRIDFHVAP